MMICVWPPKYFQILLAQTQVAERALMLTNSAADKCPGGDIQKDPVASRGSQEWG